MDIETTKQQFMSGDAVIEDALIKTERIVKLALADGEQARKTREKVEQSLEDSRVLKQKLEEQQTEQEAREQALNIRDHALLTNEKAIATLKEETEKSKEMTDNIMYELAAALAVITDRLQAIVSLDARNTAYLGEIINNLTTVKNQLDGKMETVTKATKQMEKDMLLLRDRRKLQRRQPSHKTL